MFLEELLNRGYPVCCTPQIFAQFIQNGWKCEGFNETNRLFLTHQRLNRLSNRSEWANGKPDIRLFEDLPGQSA
jgi:hypothetical protein